MRQYVLVFMLFSAIIAYSQPKLPFTSSKPLNKGNVVLNLGYERQPEFKSHGEAPKLCLSAGYGIADWCVAGVYADFGRNFGSDESIGMGDYWCQYYSNYLSYGIHAEFHPIAPLLPGFYFLDVYAILRGGMHHFICDKVAEQGGNKLQDLVLSGLKNTASPYVAGGWGVAINPSKYFGVFYERTYMSLEQCNPELANGGKHHLYHRFGLNVRFGGPRKWQRTGQ